MALDSWSANFSSVELYLLPPNPRYPPPPTPLPILVSRVWGGDNNTINTSTLHSTPTTLCSAASTLCSTPSTLWSTPTTLSTQYHSYAEFDGTPRVLGT